MMASSRTAATSSGVISGSGLAMAKMIGLSAMDLHHVRVSAPLTDRPKNTSAPSIGFRQRAVLGVDRMGRLPLVHALFAALIDDALGESHRPGDIRRVRSPSP